MLNKQIEVSLKSEMSQNFIKRTPQVQNRRIFISLRNLHKERVSRSSSYGNNVPSLKNIYETEKKWKEMKEELRNHSVGSIKLKAMRSKGRLQMDFKDKNTSKNTSIKNSDSENIENEINEEKKYVKKSIVRLFPIDNNYKRNSLLTSLVHKKSMQKSGEVKANAIINRPYSFSFRIAHSNACSDM